MDSTVNDAESWERCDDFSGLSFCMQYTESFYDRYSDRKYRLLLVAAVRVAWEFLMDPRVRHVIELAEQHADVPQSVDLDSLGPLCAEISTEFPQYDPCTAVAMIDLHGRLDPPWWVDAMCHVFPKYLPIERTEIEAHHYHGRLLRDIIGNPFRPVAFSPEWQTQAAVGIASQMYEARDFANMPVLADALQDAGCDSPEILDHCRGAGPHVRGCWVVDLVLGKS